MGCKTKNSKGLRNFFLKTYSNMSLVDIHVVGLFRFWSLRGDNLGFVFLGPVFKRVDLEIAIFQPYDPDKRSEKHRFVVYW